MYRQLYMTGGIMNAVPRNQYGLGDIVKKITKPIKKGVKKIGDVVGDMDAKDVASVIALASGNPQLAASIQASGSGTGDPYLDTALSFYGGTGGFSGGSGGSGTFGFPTGGSDIDAIQQIMKMGDIASGFVDTGPDGTETMKDIERITGKGPMNEQSGGIGDFIDILGRIGGSIFEDFSKNPVATVGGTVGATAAYQDQQRINKALEKAFEDYKAEEAKKRKQYTTGEGLPSLPVTNRSTKIADVARAPAAEGGSYDEKFMELVAELREAGFSQQEAIEEARERLSKNMAMGGIMDTREAYAMGSEVPIRENQAGVREMDFRQTGGFVPPIGVKEKADDIPAMLSNNEFVFTADAVRGAGDGDVNKGAKKMYAMMNMYEGKA